MPDLTEEEYDALDEKWTKNPPKPQVFFEWLLPLLKDNLVREKLAVAI